MEKTTEDSAMRRAHLMVAAAGIFLGLGGFVFFGSHAGLSVLTGAVIASVNLLVLARTVQKTVEGAGASWAGVALIKFLVLMVVTYGLIRSELVLPLGLAVGFGALPLGILVAGTLPTPVNIDPNVKSDHA